MISWDSCQNKENYNKNIGVDIVLDYFYRALCEWGSYGASWAQVNSESSSLQPWQSHHHIFWSGKNDQGKIYIVF